VNDVTSHLRGAGFSDEEITAWATDERNKLLSAGFSNDEVDDYFGAPKTPQQPPQALIDRFMQGTAIGRIIGAAGKGITAGFGDQPLGASEEYAKWLATTAKLPAPIRFLTDAIGNPAEIGFDALSRGFNAGITGLAEAAGQTAKEAGEQPAMAERLTRDVYSAANIAALLAGSQAPMTRMGVGTLGKVEDQAIGHLPRGEDFSDAGRAIGNGDTTPLMEDKLAELYERTGIHPAEVAHDAQTDPAIAQSNPVE
jgi:hypothetical protein